MGKSSGLGPLSIAGISLGVLGLGLAFSDLPTLAVWPALLGAVLAERSVGKATSEVKVWAAIMAGTLLGATATLSVLPWVGLGLTLVMWGRLFRLALVSYFGTSGWWWLDGALAYPGLGLVVAGALQLHAWTAWALVLYSAFYCFSLTMGSIAAVKSRAHNRGGYRVEPGRKAPDFSLADQDGFPVTLAAFQGRSHVLLIFVRGDWCPSCHITLRTYARNRERFQDQGVTLLAIGPDPMSVNQRMVQELGVPYKMLSDEGQRTAMAYGVQLNDSFAKQMLPDGVPLPASFLVDKTGTVRYTSRPERAGEFLDPKTIFPVLQALPA